MLLRFTPPGVPLQTAALASILLAVSGELAVWLELHAVLCTALNKYCPDGRPE
jgi:hypothetical protein